MGGSTVYSRLAALLCPLKRPFTDSLSSFVLYARGEGGSHITVTGMIVGNFEKNPLKGTRILFCGRGPNNFFPY